MQLYSFRTQWSIGPTTAFAVAFVIGLTCRKVLADPPPADAAPFELQAKQGEHPLAASQRLLPELLERWTSTVKDYEAVFYKQERIDGELLEEEKSLIKVRHKPFSAYIFCVSPFTGRECVYQAKPDGAEGSLSVRDSGWRGYLGVVKLGPKSTTAMSGQRHPITMLGIGNLIDQMIQVGKKDLAHGDCEVRTSQAYVGMKESKRATTLLEVVHPVRHKEFRFHIAKIYLDNELRVPIRYEEFSWADSPSASPPLEAAYTYLDVKLNVGLTDADFSTENPEYFK